jgi:hypothetical protein
MMHFFFVFIGVQSIETNEQIQKEKKSEKWRNMKRSSWAMEI